MTTEKTPNIVGKITIKSIGANPKEAIKQEKRVVLCAIYGSAVETKQVMGINGEPDDALLGTFEAVNVADGEIYRAGKLFLPKIAQQLVASEVKRLAKSDTAGSVDFAFEIAAKPDSTVAIGYTYEVRSLVKPSVADPLEQLRSKILSENKQLHAAPANVEKTSKK